MLRMSSQRIHVLKALKKKKKKMVRLKYNNVLNLLLKKTIRKKT